MNILVLIGSGIIMVLGIAHLVLTLQSSPTRGPMAPLDPRLQEAMTVRGGIGMAPDIDMPLWAPWVGFNLSHSIGVLAIGAYMFFPALADFSGALDRPEWVIPTLALPVIYLGISIRCWFADPTRAIGLATVLIVTGTLGGLVL